MKLSKKVTDFIVLDEGNMGGKSAMVTGAALAVSVLGAAVLTPTPVAGGPHCDVDEWHWDGWCVYWHCQGHYEHHNC